MRHNSRGLPWSRHGLPLAERIKESSLVDPATGCWLWQKAKYPNGYGLIGIRKDGKTRSMPAHRASFEAFRELIPAGLWVLHKCDVPICVNPEHLFLGTNHDNVLDMWAKGRAVPPPWVPGEKQGASKLTEAAVRDIRRRYGMGESQYKLAADYDVTQANISRIVTRQTWVYID